MYQEKIFLMGDQTGQKSRKEWQIEAHGVVCILWKDGSNQVVTKWEV
jgi:hypothetical protein